MRQWFILYAGIVGLALLPSATSDASQHGRLSDTSIRTILSLLPAQPWSADVDGFSAFDLKAIRSYLNIDWPEDGPETGDDAWPAAIVQLMAHVSPPPRALTPWIVGDFYEVYAELGLNQAAIGGVAETPVIGRQQISVLVGDSLADASRLTAALGQGTAVDGTEAFAYWNARDVGRDQLLRSDRLLAFSPDIVIAQDRRLNVFALAGVVTGNAPSLVQEPIVDALLWAIDSVADDDETLVALFALHPDNFGVSLGLHSDEWPAEAALPGYEMVAFGLRFGADTMTSMIVLMYQDDATARTALDEMHERFPFASSQIDMPVDDAMLVETQTGWQAVIVSSEMPASALGQQGVTTAFAAWISSLTRALDVRLVAPNSPDP